jgi:hypothetical protein
VIRPTTTVVLQHKTQPRASPLTSRCDRKATRMILIGHSHLLVALHRNMTRLRGILPSTSLPNTTLQGQPITPPSRLPRLTTQLPVLVSLVRKRRRSAYMMDRVIQACSTRPKLLWAWVLLGVLLGLHRSRISETCHRRVKRRARLHMAISHQRPRFL